MLLIKFESYQYDNLFLEHIENKLYKSGRHFVYTNQLSISFPPLLFNW